MHQKQRVETQTCDPKVFLDNVPHRARDQPGQKCGWRKSEGVGPDRPQHLPSRHHLILARALVITGLPSSSRTLTTCSINPRVGTLPSVLVSGPWTGRKWVRMQW